MTGPAKVVIVGAGLAGLRVAEELRARRYTGSVTLIGAEVRPPYDRPPLSKRVLSGQVTDTSLRADTDALDIDLRLAEPAVELAEGVVRTDRAEYESDAVVLATGALPVRLPGSDKQRVLRTAEDALALRKRLQPGTKLVVVGAGWIGAELATAAAKRGCDVTVVEAADVPLASAVAPEIGRVTESWYAQAGVELRLGIAVEAIEDDGVALGDGSTLGADLVVTAVGVRPAIEWLAGSGVRLENGVAVDEHLQTTVAGVYAAGDCAAFWSRRYQRQLRFEHWDVALHAPEVAAANVMGGSDVYDPVPYFWSEQFGRMVQYVGWHGAADQLIWRGDPGGERWAVCWLRFSKMVAALTVGLPRDLLQARRLIEAAVTLDADKLADPGVAVRDCAVSDLSVPDLDRA